MSSRKPTVTTADPTRLAEWVFRRVGQRGELRPYALAVAFGLHWVPVQAGKSRLVGKRIEYSYSASEARKRRQIMRECARAVLRHHGVSDDNRAAAALAGLLSASSSAPSLRALNGGGLGTPNRAVLRLVPANDNADATEEARHA